MRVEIKEIQIDEQTIQPTLKIGVWLEFDYYLESPISITGRLLINNKVVSTINEFQLNTDYELGLKILSRDKKDKLRNKRNTDRYFAQLSAVFTTKTIDYIENQREKDPEKSVNFYMEFIVKYLEIPAEPQNIRNDTFINIKAKRYYKNFNIEQSKWVKKYAPYLGVGDFLLLELELPNKEVVAGDWIELYDRFYQRLNDMEQSLRSGDWQKTLTYSRQLLENLKFDSKKFKSHRDLKDTLKELFLNDQHSEQGFNDFYSGIFHFFNYTSKFIHDKSNQTGELNKIPIPTKEDAYFIYSLGLGLLNIIGKKINKAAGNKS